ncbi:protein MTSS 1-like isoform X4 [Haliotis asinina]|uniref:protein MTSS 1-like isoform X4 n=1 Tax=Haliotis asinina TaxID=109174 RepID=UPI003532130C
MDGNISVEKDCSALGGLFQAVINDMRGSSPIWEDFAYKATKMHSSLKSTLIAISAFLDAFQKVADMATSSRGATKEIGSALTRLCMRHRSIESKLKSFTGCMLDTLVAPIQDKLEEWKKVVAQLDKDHAKEYKKARQEIKKAASDTVRLQKKAKKGKGDIQSRLDNAMQDVNDKYLLLEESEKSCVRTALIEERARYCVFVSALKPFVDSEISLLTEVTHLQEIIDSLCAQSSDPNTLPPSSEQVIMDLKGVDHSVWNFQVKQTPPSSPSSLGSRKSSMCSISSINSSSSGSTQSHSPSHHNVRNRTTSQQPTVGTQRLMSVSSQDSGFTSQDTLFLRPTTPLSLNLPQNSDKDSTSTGTPDVDSTPTTPSEHYPATPSASSTWNNWPNAPNNAQKGEDFRPHTISSAYEKSHHNRPALKAELFQPPAPEMLEKLKEADSRGAQGGAKHGRPHSTVSASPYSRPSATINKMQPVLPPLGPKPKPKAVPPPMVPHTVSQTPIYANAAEIAQMAADKKKDVEPVIVHSPDSDTSSSPPTPSNNAAAQQQMQQNSLELAEAIRELEASTAALECTYDTQSHTSHTSLQCSSGYGTMNSTPSGSEDTIASGVVGNWSLFSCLRDKIGIPTPTTNNSLSRRTSANSARPPPPVRRTVSVTGASPAAQKVRASPPREMSAPPQGPVMQHKRTPSGDKHSDGPYAELQLIQQSIHDTKLRPQHQRQVHPHPQGHSTGHPQGRGHHQGHPQGHGPGHPPGYPQGHGPGQHQGHPQGHGPGQHQGHPQGHGPGHPQRHPASPHNHHQQRRIPQHHRSQQQPPHQQHSGGSASPSRAPPGSSPHYAEPHVIPEQTHGHANVIQSLTRKFSESVVEEPTANDDFPLPPTEEELQEMEQIYSKAPPPTRAPTQDSLVLELKRRVADSSEV